MHHNDDVSLSAQSVFDWGTVAASSKASGRPRSNPGGDGGSSVATTGTGATGDEAATGSRYDPKAMSRIVDITDLVDESSDGDDSDDDIVGGMDAHGNGGHGGGLGPGNAAGGKANGGSDRSFGSIGSIGSLAKMGNFGNRRGSGGNGRNGEGGGGKRQKYGPGGNGLMCRQVMILVALSAVIVAASIGIGYAVLSTGGGEEGGGAAVPPMSSASDQQSFLELAERIIQACDENSLDVDLTKCQSLCRANMCCFESGDYNCADDESKKCAVYAGCEALVEGIIYDADGGAEEEED